MDERVKTAASNGKAGMAERGDLSDRVAEIGRLLAESITGVLDELPGAPLKPMELSRALKLNKDLSSRVVKAAGLSDPMAVAQQIPGPAPLRKMLKAASVHVRRDTVQRALETVDRFGRLIETEAGDRSAFDAMISSWLPETREAHEFSARQTAFRGMSKIKGMSAETNLCSVLLHPSAERADRADFVSIQGLFALHRIHSEACARVATRIVNPPDAPTRLSVSGEPIREADDARLNGFCPEPILHLESVRHGDSVVYSPVPADEGMGASANLLLGEYTKGIMPMYRAPDAIGPGHAAVAGEITIPVRRLILDALVHRDVFPGAEPMTSVFDMNPMGFANPNDPSREVDRLRPDPPVRYCGTGVRYLRAAEAPRYTEMLEHVCMARGWDPESFRGYRVSIEYPTYGSQVCIMFPREPAPE